MSALERLTEAVDRLTKPRTHRQPYSYHDTHGTLVHTVNVVHVVSLLDQLGHTITPGSGTDLTSGHAVPGSRPTGRLESLDALLWIDNRCSQLIGIYGGTDRPALVDNLRSLVGMTTALESHDQDDVASESCRWVSRALSVTGWADPAWRPNNTCPLCGVKRSLRVRAVTASEIHASCVGCGEVWTPETVGILAEHIRWENSEDMEATA